LPFKCNLQRYSAEAASWYANTALEDAKYKKVTDKAAGLCRLNQVDP
jgi:hypothetical protein